jgi:hypothetical protein
MQSDPHCLNFLCNFGKMESGKEASVHIQLEGRPSILEMVSLKYAIPSVVVIKFIHDLQMHSSYIDRMA